LTYCSLEKLNGRTATPLKIQKFEKLYLIVQVVNRIQIGVDGQNELGQRQDFQLVHGKYSIIEARALSSSQGNLQTTRVRNSYILKIITRRIIPISKEPQRRAARDVNWSVQPTLEVVNLA
jgi:hypothetical protein